MSPLTESHVHFSGPEHKEILVKFQDYVQAFWLPQAAERVSIIRNRIDVAVSRFYHAVQVYEERSWLYRLVNAQPTFTDVNGNLCPTSQQLTDAVTNQMVLRMCYDEIHEALKAHDETTPFEYSSDNEAIYCYLQRGYQLCRPTQT